MAASDRIDELKKRYDENPRRFFASLANEYRKGGDLEQAISLCQTHLAEQPSNMNGHVVYGQALFEAGRYDEAKGTFESALNLDPENLIALRHLGDIASTNGANEEAREWYVRVLDADPRNEEIIALLAHVEEQVKKDKIGAPIASLESMAPREARTQEFKPPTVITPLSTASVDTVVTPAVSIPAVPPRVSRESIGLMDLSFDVDSIPETADADATPVSAQPGVETDFPAFEEVQLGVPLETPLAALPVPDDMMMDPFADPEPEPALEPVRQTFAPMPPIAEASTGIRSDVDMLFGDSLPAEPAPPFVTETMAELYLQQGFVKEALEVYHQLSEQSPDDERLKERVRKLERGERTSVSLEAEPVPEAEPEPVASSGPVNARSYFAALSARKAVQNNGRAHTAPRISAPRVSAPRVSAPRISAPVAAMVNVTSINELFGAGDVSAQDELIAGAFAQVAGAVEMKGAAVKGKPTAPAATELSLDSVFKEADARVSATVPRQSQNLRFDQFFSAAGEESAPPAPPAPSAPVGEPGSPAEIKQFQSWLTGLKKP